MYFNEYVTIPIKFEFTFLMVALGIFFNIGIFLALSEWGLNHKKITCVFLIFTSFVNAFLLLITNGNPFYSIPNEYWNTIRYLCIYGVIVLGGVLCILVGGYRSEN
jgi:uncharacterized phage infection (PIP) family protein YhgE